MENRASRSRSEPERTLVNQPDPSPRDLPHQNPRELDGGQLPPLATSSKNGDEAPREGGGDQCDQLLQERVAQVRKAAATGLVGAAQTDVLLVLRTIGLASAARAPPTEAQLGLASSLLDELARKDPLTLDQIDLQNRRRLVRAVEVIRITGQPFSVQRARWPEQGGTITTGRAFGIQRDRQDLVRRIHERVDRMFQAGLVQETRELLKQGLHGNRTALQAIGYRQVVEHLDGSPSLRETVERVQTKTRQFAKRQMTWMQGQLDLAWLEVGTNESPAQTAERILKTLLPA